MSYYGQNKPIGAPNCWSFKFQDGDPECAQCRFRDSCRPAAINRMTHQPVTPTQNLSQQAVPMPSRPFAAPTFPGGPPRAAPISAPTPAQPYRGPIQFQNPPPVPAPQTTPSYQQNAYSAGYIPDPNLPPHPMTPMYRPGAPGPAYYFTQYPGETTTKRLAKNMTLRGAEAVFGELMFFFRHWTWPPRT